MLEQELEPQQESIFLDQEWNRGQKIQTPIISDCDWTVYTANCLI